MRNKIKCKECLKIILKKNTYWCVDCGATLCASHSFCYVDESNEAITKNSSEWCRECYLKKHKR